MIASQSSQLRPVRRVMFVLRYGVVLIALLAIAWPAVPPKTKPGLAGSEWRFIEVAGANTPGAGTLRFTQTSIRGKAACTVFSGAFRESHGRIEIAGLIPAHDAGEKAKNVPVTCKGLIGLERSLLESLARVATYTLDGGVLQLLDVQGHSLARLVD